MDYLYAFLCGGVLCAAGQVLIDKTKLTPARILTGYVVLGVLLSALGLYQPLVDLAGAGATVPLTGFGHALAKGVGSRGTQTETGAPSLFSKKTEEGVPFTSLDKSTKNCVQFVTFLLFFLCRNLSYCVYKIYWFNLQKRKDNPSCAVLSACF